MISNLDKVVCKISDLYVEVLDLDCFTDYEPYRTESRHDADVIVNLNTMNCNLRPSKIDENVFIYLKSGFQFYRALLGFDGMMLHASAACYGGKAYLFSGPCGMGKSTHTRLWQSTFGDAVKIFNDDKPALRRMEDRWYAYGTPWCGKDHININMKVPLAGICFLKQAPENRIRRLDSMEALQRLMTQTLRKRLDAEQMNLLLSHLDKLIREIPIFELENRPEPEAARLSYETMRKAAEEKGL